MRRITEHKNDQRRKKFPGGKMGFRKQNHDRLICSHPDCKACAMDYHFEKMGIDFPGSWRKALRQAVDNVALFAFLEAEGNRWHWVSLLFSEIYLIHIWGMYETHGLTALYREGKTKLSDVISLTDEQLLGIWGFGKKSLAEIRAIQRDLSIIPF